jgi:dTDP-4-amino-4,6-dideoxygalactose transaminase
MTEITMVPFLDVKAAYAELRAELDAAVRRVLESGWYILGEEVEAFEREFAAYCGARECIGVSNGLAALELLLRAHGIGPGDEVLVPSNTFIATWLAVTHCGATPVPVEPDPRTFNIDARAIDAAGPRCRAVIAVHLYGQCADMGPLLERARARNLIVIEDAAQAQGATYAGARAGSLADGAAFSFYPGKNLGAFGDAGGVTTNDPAIADRVRLLRNYGSREKYHHEILAFNSRLDPMQAALLRVKLRKLDEWNDRRRAVAARYSAAFADAGPLLPPVVGDRMDPAWHLYVVQHPRRDSLREHLQAEGIGTIMHYPVPPHLTPAYEGLGLRRGSLPVAEQLADRILSLPMGPHLGPDAVEQVIEAVLRHDA